MRGLTDHGYRRYKDHGCRCDVCRAANTLEMARYKVKRARNGGVEKSRIGLVGGHLDVPVGPTRKQLKQLHRQMTWEQMAQLCGISRQVLRSIALRNKRGVRAENAKKIAALHADVFAPVAKDTRRFSAEPLIEAVEARYGSMMAAGGRVMVHRLCRLRRTGLSAEQADKWAMELLGLLPHEVWDRDSILPNPEKTPGPDFSIGRSA